MTPQAPRQSADDTWNRQRLADELTQAGDLRTPQWRAAVEAVRRELFVPAFFRQVDQPRETLWEPLTAGGTDTDAWLGLIYTNDTLITQIDHKITADQVTAPVRGVPTSSSTLPGLVVAMLEELNVTDDSRVLEIGTGTGYSTALMSYRLGDDRITSIEVDPAVAAAAARSIHAAGYSPQLVVGDGLAGCEGNAPYDRIIATCSARCVPNTWLAQIRPHGQILQTLTGWLGASSGLVRIHVTGDRTGYGEFLGDQASFMPARAHEQPPLTDAVYELVSAEGTHRPTRAGVEILDPTANWTATFLAQLAAPTSQRLTFSTEDGPMIDYLVDEQHQSYAALLPQPDGTHHVRQGGPIALWDRIETAVNAWQEAGSPGLDQFRLTIRPTEQIIHLGPPDSSTAWPLPTELTS